MDISSAQMCLICWVWFCSTCVLRRFKTFYSPNCQFFPLGGISFLCRSFFFFLFVKFFFILGKIFIIWSAIKICSTPAVCAITRRSDYAIYGACVNAGTTLFFFGNAAQTTESKVVVDTSRDLRPSIFKQYNSQFTMLNVCRYIHCKNVNSDILSFLSLYQAWLVQTRRSLLPFIGLGFSFFRTQRR